jgi:hypothetical protein
MGANTVTGSAVEINKSAATLYRKLAMMQKAVIEEIGVIETEETRD